jgi:hypothetical protein
VCPGRLNSGGRGGAAPQPDQGTFHNFGAETPVILWADSENSFFSVLHLIMFQTGKGFDNTFSVVLSLL